MRRTAQGLRDVPTRDLETALKWLHRGELACPLSLEELARIGLQHCAEELMGQLRDLEHRGVRAVLVAVIAERHAEAARWPSNDDGLL